MSLAEKCSKWPKRMKLGATRVTTAAVSISSRRTDAGDPVMHSARVVGTPRPCMASLHRNSRMLERSTARPSPMREYGVRPAPLSWISSPAAVSPSRMARPSPSWPAQIPNWCPLYTLAKGCEPGSTALPVKACKAASLRSQGPSTPTRRATLALVPTQWGSGNGVGCSSVKKAGPRAAKPCCQASPDAATASLSEDMFMHGLSPRGDAPLAGGACRSASHMLCDQSFQSLQ